MLLGYGKSWLVDKDRKWLGANHQPALLDLFPLSLLPCSLIAQLVMNLPAIQENLPTLIRLSGPPSLGNGLTQITRALYIAKANQQFSILILPMSRFWHGWSCRPSWNTSLCLAQAEIFLGNVPPPSHYCSPVYPERSKYDNRTPSTYQSPAAGCAQSHGKW